MEIDWDNKQHVLYAVYQNGYNLNMASDRLKDDYDVVMYAVKDNIHYLSYASYRLRDDYSVVSYAVKKCGLSLQYASQRLQDDINLLRLLRVFHRINHLVVNENNEKYKDWYNKRMELLEMLELEEELLNSIPENNVTKKIVKF